MCAERAFVHEWTKFRYGVFEEIGFENDPIYPTAYPVERRGSRRNRGDDELEPTACTNSPLHGNW